MDLGRFLHQGREATRLVAAVVRERIETGHVFNPLSGRNRGDPYSLYRRLREADPVHRSHAVDGWVLFRHADVLELLRDGRFSADDRNFRRHPELRARAVREGLADPEDESPVMLRSDPPDHPRLRGLVNKAFTPRAVEKLRPRIEEIAEELVADCARRGRFDAIADFAVPLPVTIIAEMLGIPSQDRNDFKRWSDALIGFLDPQASPGPKVLIAVRDEMFDYFGRVVAERRARPADDLLSALVLAEEAGDRLTERELFGTVALLLAAGNETTTNLIGNGLLALLRHPDQQDRLRQEPALVESAVEELLRFDSPVQFTARIPREDVAFGGCEFRQGQMVVAVLGAANRDPEVFPDPDRLDVARADNRHLSFGFGAHFCLGAPLARLEARIAFEHLLRRLPELRLDVDADALRWRKLSFLRGLEALPLRG